MSDAEKSQTSEQRPVRYLASICDTCRHTYNYHASNSACAHVNGQLLCPCARFVDQPSGDTIQSREPVVMVDGPECDHAPRTGGACLPCAVKYWEAECGRLREELSQAGTFGRGEFRVTTWAYEQAVRTMNEAKAEVERLRAREVPDTGQPPLDFDLLVRSIVGSRYMWISMENAVDMAVTTARLLVDAGAVVIVADGQPIEVHGSLSATRRLVHSRGITADERDHDVAVSRPVPPLEGRERDRLREVLDAAGLPRDRGWDDVLLALRSMGARAVPDTGQARSAAHCPSCVSRDTGEQCTGQAREPRPVYPQVWCDDSSGPNGIGGTCVLGPGHLHRDGLGGEWPVEPSGDTGQAPDVDWLARFCAAAEAADNQGWTGTAVNLYDLASQLSPNDEDDSDAVIEVIGRALLGTDTTPEAGQ